MLHRPCDLLLVLQLVLFLGYQECARRPRRGNPMTDTGRFLLLGSGEFEPWSGDAERFALSGASGDGTVVVLATASGREGEAVFDRWTTMGLAHYASLNIPSIAVRVRNRDDAMAPGMADAIDSASMVF